MQPLTSSCFLSDDTSYLTAVEELTFELQRAMAAVRMNAVAGFEQSVVRQQINCTHLSELRRRPCVAVGAAPVGSVFVDPTLAQRIQAATSTLNVVVRQYSMLLKHFGGTARLFAGMFRTYGDPAVSNFGVQQPRGDWSCEL